MPFTTLKTVVAAPMASASVAIGTIATLGRWRISRRAYRRSCRTERLTGYRGGERPPTLDDDRDAYNEPRDGCGRWWDEAVYGCSVIDWSTRRRAPLHTGNSPRSQSSDSPCVGDRGERIPTQCCSLHPVR